MSYKFFEYLTLILLCISCLFGIPKKKGKIQPFIQQVFLLTKYHVITISLWSHFEK